MLPIPAWFYLLRVVFWQEDCTAPGVFEEGIEAEFFDSNDAGKN
jgi:hypothetical protein